MEAKINSFSILVYLRKDQKTKDGECAVMERTIVNGEIVQFSTKMKILPENGMVKL
ncbi:MAG: hypothetical protein LBL90_02350 [Prevotellaceae bacterium]|jgi:hypothetical protein|nr:hypothetical protein [Prevotellaceae bacterium]